MTEQIEPMEVVVLKPRLASRPEFDAGTCAASKCQHGCFRAEYCSLCRTAIIQTENTQCTDI
jgi:hypothetical protein